MNTDIFETNSSINKNIDTIVYYGSSARGDSDRLSDKDLLLISDNEKMLNASKLQYERKGFSCSCYGWYKISQLVVKKALFIQHLKQESIIIKDSSSRFGGLLSSFQPSNDYTRDIESTKHLALLTEKLINSPSCIGWALDILAVAFRNIAILTFANEGNYIFSYSDILYVFRIRGLISHEEEEVLGKLRWYKSYYRSRLWNQLPDINYLFKVQKIIGRLFGIVFESSTSQEVAFQHYCLHSEKATMDSYWYIKMRLFEGAFITLSQCVSAMNPEIFDRYLRIQETFTNPSCYHLFLADEATHLRSELLSLILEVNAIKELEEKECPTKRLSGRGEHLRPAVEAFWPRHSA